ncbi:MAG: VOC family protein [Gemmatimonadota bacterium]
MPRPVHFEIHCENAERAANFYRTLFGWTITKWDGPWEYWLVGTGSGTPGIDGALVSRRGPAPAADAPVSAYVITMDVASCDDSVAAITANGGTIALPKMPIPGIGWLAYGKDTEGNIFGVMQGDKSVK